MNILGSGINNEMRPECTKWLQRNDNVEIYVWLIDLFACFYNRTYTPIDLLVYYIWR